MATVLLSENFDGVSPPTKPATLNYDTSLVTAASSLNSSPNVLRLAGVAATNKRSESASVSSAADGNMSASLFIRQTGSAAGGNGGIILGQSATPIPATGTGIFWQMQLNLNQPSGFGVQVYDLHGGTATSLGSFGNRTDFAAGVAYKLVASRLFDQNGLCWGRVDVQRQSDGYWYQGYDSGSWAVGHVPALRVQSDLIAAGAHKAGTIQRTENYADTVDIDSFAWYSEPPITWQVHGDSISEGVTASGGGWPDLLATLLSTSINNQARGYSQVADQAALMLQTPPHPLILMIGTNDQASDAYYNDATKQGIWKSCVKALAAYAACPTGTLGQAGTNKTGTWTNNTIYSGSMDLKSVVAGSKVDFPVTGDSAFVMYTLLDPLSTSVATSFTVKSDGGSVLATVSCSGPIRTTHQFNLDYGPQLLTLTGLGSGAHTITIEATGTGGIFIDRVWSPGQQSAYNDVYLCTVHDQSATGYTATGSSLAINAVYNALLSDVASELTALGLPVSVIDTRAALNTTTHLSADGYHLSDAGEAAAAAAVYAALVPTSIKSSNGILAASIKSFSGILIAEIKSRNGVLNS